MSFTAFGVTVGLRVSQAEALANELKDKLGSDADAMVKLTVVKLQKAGLLEKSEALQAQSELGKSPGSFEADPLGGGCGNSHSYDA